MLQRLAQSGDYDALVALGAVIRGETYHLISLPMSQRPVWRACTSNSNPDR
jgi:hypothetical protein